MCKRRCTSLRDLVRKYKLYGDGLFYLPVGHRPRGEKELALDNVKWMGVTATVGAQRETKRRRRRQIASERSDAGPMRAVGACVESG